MRRRWQRWLAMGGVLLAASPLLAPELRAFPYHRQMGDKPVHSVAPIERAALESVIARADPLTGASPLAQLAETRHIFLTDGGWRWRRLGPGSAVPKLIERAR